mgnify:CR=1 FL=1
MSRRGGAFPDSIHGPVSKPPAHLRYRISSSRPVTTPMMATAGKACVVEVEEIVPTGSLDPDHIHTPGVYVDRLVQTLSEKRIEQRTTRKKETA